ncbi:hypothetical protein Tco_0762058 [Tanacetum coccineum]
MDVDLFTCDTPLGMIFDEFNRLSTMEDDLLTYEVGVLEPSYIPNVEQPYDDLENGDLDVYEPRQYLKFRDHKKVDKEIMEVVVATWLIQSYKERFEEYMEIKRRLEVNGINTDMECDLTNVDFVNWLASKFSNHMTMDWYIKNALWLYWKRVDEEEVLTDDKIYDLEEESISEDNENVEIFRIEMNIFTIETPLCKEFKEFNHLLHIDVDVLTGDLPGFKTYEDYKNAWIYEWNNEVPWVEEKPWLEDRIWKEPIDEISHECKLFHYEWYEGLEDGDLKEETLKEKAILEGSWGHENRKGKNFCSWLKESFGNYHDLDCELMLKLKEYWWGKKEEEELKRFDDHEPMGDDDDDDIRDLDDYLNNAPYYVDEEDKEFKERRRQIYLGYSLRENTTQRF